MATLPAVGPDTDLDVRYYALVLWRGRAIVATAGLVALLLGVLVAFLQTPEYRASALLQIEPPVPVVLNVNEALAGVGGYWQNTDFYNTQFKILTSKTVGEKALERLRLQDRPPFKDSGDAASLLMSHVAVEPVPDSRLVSLVVTHDDPKEAALWANTIAETYIQVSLETRIEAARKAYDWIQQRLAATQRGMREAQERLFKTSQSQNLFVPEGSVSAVSRSIAKLNEDYVDAQARRIALEAALKQALAMREKGESLAAIPQVAADQTVAGFNSQLANLELELARMKDRYKEGHPEVQRVRGQAEELQKARERRAGEVVESLRVEYAQLQRREAELRAAGDAQKNRAAEQSQRITELETLRKEADSAKNLYDVLLQKLNESDIAASIRTNNVTLIEQASPPRRPVRPDKPRVAGLALLLGLALGAGLVLGRDYLDNTLKDAEDVERYLHLDLLAVVPRYEQANAHLVTEAYQNLRTALLFGRKDAQGQVILVTGTAPQEGKTTTLVNIGKLLAASGERTLLIDLDLRRATLHTQLGLAREPGITHHFLSPDPVAELIRPTRVANLFALTSGTLPPNPPALLARKTLGELLGALRTRFEWILIDSPPLASVTDGLLLARHADLVILVVQHNKVDKKLVKRVVGSLRKVGASPLGVVLNAMDVKATGHYHYYYYHQHEQPEADRAKPKATAGRRGP